MKWMIVYLFLLPGLPLALAQLPPFPFGNATNDIFTPLGRDLYGPRLTLPKPMAYLNSNANFISQNIQGYVALESADIGFLGFVTPYFTDVYTGDGGEDQNQVSMRVGNAANDLILAREIIAGNGTIFNPQAVLVATWYKVELYEPVTNLRNTFQLAMAWSDTGETWGIFAYSRLEYFDSNLRIEYTDGLLAPLRIILTIRDNAAMTAVLNGTNCSRKGVYAFRINQGTTTAPSSSPTVVPTAAPSNVPTMAPSAAPSSSPTMVPTTTPSHVPTMAPTATPSNSPTMVPTAAPSTMPTMAPSATPSNSPTTVPTDAPTSLPTNAPSVSPISAPVPTDAPTTPEQCGLFGWSLICPRRHPVWFLLTLAGLVPTILFILVHL